eukprot:scaffold110793_cov19-Tisochrysis_lutea.AAC.3
MRTELTALHWGAAMEHTSCRIWAVVTPQRAAVHAHNFPQQHRGSAAAPYAPDIQHRAAAWRCSAWQTDMAGAAQASGVHGTQTWQMPQRRQGGTLN